MSKAYLNDYTSDIFVSYTHRDVEQIGADRDSGNWTRRAVGELRRLLENDLNGKIEIFLDVDKLDWDSDLTGALLEQVDKSALLLVFVSKKYLGSKWCAQEIKKFKTRNRWPDDPKKTGIFIVEVEPADYDKLSSDLRDSGGNPQIRLALYNEGELPYGLHSNSPDAYKLTDGLNKLAKQMRASLEALKKQEKESGQTQSGQLAQAGAGAAATKRVFLAYPADRRAAETHDQIEKLLKAGPYEVTPLPPLTEFQTDDQLRKGIRAYLEKSGAYVQVLSETSGHLNLTEVLFKEAESRKMPVFLWRPDDLDPSQVDEYASPHYKAFAEKYFKEAQTGDPAELVKCVVQLLEPKAAPEADGTAAGLKAFRPGRAPQVFIYSIDPKGYTFVKRELEPQISDVIQEELCDLTIPHENAGPRVIEEFCDELAEKCDALIMVKSEEHEQDVRKVINDLYMKFNSKNPDKALYIGMIERPPGMKFERTMSGIEVFDCSDTQVNPNLRNWLKELRKTLGS